MRTIFIDENFKCHVEYTDGMRVIETDVFDGKCSKYIEGYRYVPDGETWVRSDGVEFSGGMIAPFKPYDKLEAAQQAYEEAMAEVQAQFEDMKSALEILGVAVDE